MIKISKFIFITLFILLGLFNSANAADADGLAKTDNIEAAKAADISLLNLNVFAWSIFNYQTNAGPAGVITSYINENKFDFITTQEFQGGVSWNGYGGPWGYLTNHGDQVRWDPTKGKDVRDADYGLDPKYKMVVAPADPILYYDSNKWSFGDYRSINMTADTGGARTAVFATFTRTDGSGKSVVVATTHLCIAYSGNYCLGSDPQNREYSAHIQDAQILASYIKNNYSSTTPVILTGDFNSMTNPVNQAIDIKNKLLAANLNPVIDNNTKTFPGPTMGALTIDFVYSNNLNVANSSLYSGSSSDHKGIRVDFNFGDTPPPVPCDAPDNISAPYSPTPGQFGSTTININSNAIENVTAVELLGYNHARILLTQGKELSKYDQFGSAAGPKGYEYYARNICGNNYSSEVPINVYPTKN